MATAEGEAWSYRASMAAQGLMLGSFEAELPHRFYVFMTKNPGDTAPGGKRGAAISLAAPGCVFLKPAPRAIRIVGASWAVKVTKGVWSGAGRASG